MPASRPHSRAAGGNSSCDSERNCTDSGGKRARPEDVYVGSDYGEFDRDGETGASTALDFKVTACDSPVSEDLRAVQTVAVTVSADLLAVEALMPGGSGSRTPSLSVLRARGGGAGGLPEQVRQASVVVVRGVTLIVCAASALLVGS